MYIPSHVLYHTIIAFTTNTVGTGNERIFVVPIAGRSLKRLVSHHSLCRKWTNTE